MNNEAVFYDLCKIMADLEDAIDTVETVGITFEPDKGVGKDLYEAASIAYRIAALLLEFPDVSTENDVCNQLMAMDKINLDEVSKEVWTKYGIKQYEL